MATIITANNSLDEIPPQKLIFLAFNNQMNLTVPFDLKIYLNVDVILSWKWFQQKCVSRYLLIG